MPNLDERFVRRAVIKHLRKKGFKLNLEERETKEHGVDIRVRHYKYSRYFFVEVKGEPSANVKHPSSRREVDFLNALGQIVSRMRSKSKYWYGLAFPYTFKDKVIRRLPKEICKKLRIKVLLVNKEGKIEELTWRDFK